MMNNYEAKDMLINIFDSNEFVGFSFMLLGIALLMVVLYMKDANLGVSAQ